ncbi:MAG TPA: hypothetical protein VGQ69_14465 [Gemmatimonadales bacterium]|jgi:hypothetical protein|nr:hypothetical protein [Gemmatimonadales bacterium]
MRDDMHKVIVERPRKQEFGSGRRPLHEKNTRLADLPSKEGMRRRHVLTRERKQLNENLAPLKRYLHKQVGRPWNAVYREISAKLGPGSAVKQHVRDHLWDYVERHVTLGPKGKVYCPPTHWMGPGWSLCPGDLYVHPRTGLLAVVKARR